MVGAITIGALFLAQQPRRKRAFSLLRRADTDEFAGPGGRTRKAVAFAEPSHAERRSCGTGRRRCSPRLPGCRRLRHETSRPLYRGDGRANCRADRARGRWPERRRSRSDRAADLRRGATAIPCHVDRIRPDRRRGGRAWPTCGSGSSGKHRASGCWSSSPRKTTTRRARFTYAPSRPSSCGLGVLLTELSP